MVGRHAVLVIAALGVAGNAHGGPITRSGVTWSAQPVIVHHDKAVTLSWTVTARGADKRPRRVSCARFTISEEYGEVAKGQFSLRGGYGLRAEPANACAPAEKTSVTATTSWRFEVPPRDHGDLSPGEALRARIAISINDESSVELAAVILSVGDDGVPKLTTVAKRKL